MKLNSIKLECQPFPTAELGAKLALEVEAMCYILLMGVDKFCVALRTDVTWNAFLIHTIAERQMPHGSRELGSGAVARSE